MEKKHRNKKEEFYEIHERASRLESLINLSNEIRERERRIPIPFNDFLYQISKNPEATLRDIFQLFHDMVHHYVPQGFDEFPLSKDSIGFMNYDCTKLFVEELDNPFFADRLFSNRLISLIDSIGKGTQKNNIFIFEGPPGSGKSTFLKNILQKLEDYAKTDAGTTYKAYWRIDIQELGGFQRFVGRKPEVAKMAMELSQREKSIQRKNTQINYPDEYLEFSCPNHDHPILMIPKSYRKRFLNELIPDEKIKEKLFTEKQFEWLLKDIPCTICSSIFKALMDETGDPMIVFSMLNARKNYFSRQLGEGISVFNPGDQLREKVFRDKTQEQMLHDLFKNDDIDFIYSYLAKTNNGVLALMDIKEHNVERLKNYHGIISDGVHKVGLSEEHIRTLFLGLVNPDDKKHYDTIPSFQDRIIHVRIPYILDYNTESSIYRNKFGREIEAKFLPGVLENFARIIVSTRLMKESPAIRKWINNPDKYRKYTDRNMLLLKMDIYTGHVPTWISEDDLKKFDKATRKAIIDEGEKEGNSGISGRKSLQAINSILSKYEASSKVITMESVKKFFTDKDNDFATNIPPGFIDSLIDLYDYNIVQEIKEAIYYYNEEQLVSDIKNYLFAINFDIGSKRKSDYTGDKIEITEDYLSSFEAMFLGSHSTVLQRKQFRADTQKEYITNTLYREIRIDGKDISETELFKDLFKRYSRSLKKNALAPYIDNEDFRRAIKDFGTNSFQAYNDRTKRDVELLISNLQKKFKYSEKGAKEICFYVLDKKLATKYTS